MEYVGMGLVSVALASIAAMVIAAMIKDVAVLWLSKRYDSQKTSRDEELVALHRKVDAIATKVSLRK